MRVSDRIGAPARDALVVVGIVAFAVTLRSLGLRLGLPYYHHWDEGWVVENVQRMLQTTNWQPRTYQYGAPLSALSACVYYVASAIDANVYDPNDGNVLHWLTRGVTVAITSSGVWATYLIGRHATLGDRGARTRAVYGAILYASAAELVSHGRYAATDANLVALGAWSLAFAAVYLKKRTFAAAAGTLLFAALAVAFKVTALPTVIVPVGALLLRPMRTRSSLVARGAILFALPIAGAIFLVLNPHVLLHWRDALGDIDTRMNQVMRGGVPEFSNRWPGPEHLAAVAYGVVCQGFARPPIISTIAGVLGSVGLVTAIRRERSEVVAIGVAHALATIFLIACSSHSFLYRNYLVALPIMCVGFGFAMERIHARFDRREARIAIIASFSLLFVALPVAQALRAQALSTDARIRAINWIDAHAKARATVACTPFIVTDSVGDRSELRKWLVRPNIAFAPDVTSAADVERVRPDFVVVVSHPDMFGEKPNIWPFGEVDGYRVAADFEASPWEHNFDITPTWMGRFDARVLQRE